MQSQAELGLRFCGRSTGLAVSHIVRLRTVRFEFVL
jgi:hypothetical protein